MSKKKSQALLELKYEHPIQLQPGDVLSDDEINRLSGSVSSIVDSTEKMVQHFYKKSIFNNRQYCFPKKYCFEYLVSVAYYMEEKVTDMTAICIHRFRTPIFEVNRLSYLTSMKEQQRHVCNKSLHNKGTRNSGWKVLCLQKFQAQSLCAPALYLVEWVQEKEYPI